jgi:hypothetical protein
MAEKQIATTSRGGNVARKYFCQAKKLSKIFAILAFENTEVHAKNGRQESFYL